MTTPLERFCVPAEIERMLGERQIPSLGRPAVQDLTTRFADAAASLAKHCAGSSRAVAVYSPGRTELVGKHTDYAGGRSVTCASQRAFCMVAAISPEPGLRLQDQVTGVSTAISYDISERGSDASWASYPQTVVSRICSNFGVPASGVSVVFSSDIPRAAGMSSSSAFVVGTWLCMAALLDLYDSETFGKNMLTGEDLAMYLSCVENGYPFRELPAESGVGTLGGAQDHAAILLSDPDSIGSYSYRPLKKESSLPFPDDLALVISASGLRANKGAGAQEEYNAAVQLASRSLSVWNDANGSDHSTLGAAIASPSFSIELFESVLDATISEQVERLALVNRVKQFSTETAEIIPGFLSAIRDRDYHLLGELVSRSFKMADEWLGNQVPETRFLVASAMENGAVAASAFGAGFGGSVWTFVPSAEATSFLQRWLVAYGQAFQERLRNAYFFQDAAGPGAFVLGTEATELSVELDLRPKTI